MSYFPTISTSIKTFWRTIWNLIFNGVFGFLAATGLWGAFWRPFYLILAHLYKIGVAPVKFMNYGYVPLTEDDKDVISGIQEEIQKEKKEEWTHIQLYERTLGLCPEYPDLDGLEVLEIGCGHGGGVEWIEKAHPRIQGIRGMDMTIIDDLGGKIFEGDARNIPLPDQTVDLIVNVESSHCYDDQPGFFRHSFRILRPGGYLVWTDMRPVGALLELCYSDPRDMGFKLVKGVDITENILRSLDIQHARHKAMFQIKWYTRFTSLIWHCFWGVPGTGLNRDMKEGRLKYTAICWRKPETSC